MNMGETNQAKRNYHCLHNEPCIYSAIHYIRLDFSDNIGTNGITGNFRLEEKEKWRKNWKETSEKQQSLDVNLSICAPFVQPGLQRVRKHHIFM